jgi:anti-sigma B factor antagonist
MWFCSIGRPSEVTLSLAGARVDNASTRALDFRQVFTAQGHSGEGNMPEPASHLRVTDYNGVTVVHFADRKILEELSISEIGEELNQIVEDNPELRLLLCFENVEHLSSAALGMLITLKQRVDKKNGKLRLSDIRPQIYEVFKITRLNKLFDIHDTTPKALESF